MKNRISEIRKQTGLTQEEFAKRINMSRNYIWMIEKGERVPADRTIGDICREFGVNRIWLETGVGDPFQPKDKREELKAVFSDVLSGRPSEKNAFIEAKAQLPDDVFPVLVKSWIAAAEDMKRQLNEQ